MIVYVPTPLRSYTASRPQVEAHGATLDDLLRDVDRQYPGLRFRIVNEQERVREHIKLFVNHDQVHDLDMSLEPEDQVHIICALSGG